MVEKEDLFKDELFKVDRVLSVEERQKMIDAFFRKEEEGGNEEEFDSDSSFDIIKEQRRKIDTVQKGIV